MNKKIRQLLLAVSTLLLICLPALAGNSFAASAKKLPSTNNKTSSSSGPSTSATSPVVQTYNAIDDVVDGMLVGLKSKGQTEVVPLSSQDSRSMLGVVIPASSATFTLTPTTSTGQQVLVATTGSYDVLVSSENGPIKTGDYLTISSLDGIAMSAGQNQQDIVGQALANFAGNKGTLSSTSIKPAPGENSKVTIGLIPVSLRLAPNPLYTKSSNLPGVVTKTATAIADKPVTITQIYLSLVLLFLTLFTTATIYYSGIHSSVISVGRNPLSKKSIVAALLKVLVTGLITFGAGAAAAYLVLKF